ncbi:MBL fold metallo-hydrolase [Halopelagius longus]|uniref:Glyoxylase, beta-lactamase superfamily II n=1 Tax=Halopelagius longus TaxID=1236180 RepID=A0A1H0Z4U5_9EURY|nr:rhodanese-like domain-containing protein [Halopelagius longus]RDI72833.1 MBL fold metallo-hydrolase [Halopelagius longus]SDQ22465.1 Glyoxylase, beta-lactamase superfamily II [Halopelagius longus]
MCALLHQTTVAELADSIDSGESAAVVDTRQPDSFEAWHVGGAVNVPYSPEDGLGDEWDWDRVDERFGEGPVVAICGKGISSTSFGLELGKRGYEDVSVVKGGMQEWSKLYEVVEVPTENDDLFLAQVQRRAKGCLGYVVGSRSAGEAFVVDAARQHHEFELVAADEGMAVSRVFDTHVHADHISGGPELAERLGVSYHLGERAAERDVEYDYRPLSDGETFSVGDVEMEVLAAPGHTTEMVNYLVDGEYLLSGDTLFVESVGRTELQFGDEDSATGAELLYETLHETVLELPEETRVLPGHVTVAADGEYAVASPGELVSATLGELRDELDLLDLDEEEFVARLTDDTPEKPANYETVIAVNTGRETPEDEESATELETGPNNCAA